MKRIDNIANEIDYVFGKVSSLSEIDIDFQTWIPPGMAIISKNLKQANEIITQYLNTSSLFLTNIDVIVSEFNSSEDLAQHIFQQMQAYMSMQDIPLSRDFEETLTDDIWNNINLLASELCIEKEKPVLIILRGFQDICRYFTEAQISNYLQLRERKFVLLLSASVPLRDIENASVGFHRNSTLTDSVSSIEMSE